MNNGKICVSISARTTRELQQKFDSISDKADVIEIRFDALDVAELDAAKTWARRQNHKTILSTFRPESQGGFRSLSFGERLDFWKEGAAWADLELDLIDHVTSEIQLTICSKHDFEGVPSALTTILNDLTVTKADVVKVAVMCADAADAIPLWHLLKTSDTRIVPIGMGEAGKWTRVLSLPHGAFMTYASVDFAASTAPGQISCSDLIETFRVKDLSNDVAVFGVIAGDTSYSISPWMHNAAFGSYGLDSVFVPLMTKDVEQFWKRMVDPASREIELNFKGFAVTNPHKESIISQIDEFSDEARSIGAVNTVILSDGKAIGTNTDAYGFETALKNRIGEIAGMSAAVFGAGGAARACVYALRNAGAKVTLFARNPNAAEVIANDFEIRASTNIDRFAGGFDIIVNTTPIGTLGSGLDRSILASEQLRGAKIVFDLVYNPAETQLMRAASEAGVDAISGLEMLVHQGAKQFEIWTGKPAPVEIMRAAVVRKLGS